MSEIEIGGATPGHRRVEYDYVYNVSTLWERFIKELQKRGSGTNNNELKEIAGFLVQATIALRDHVYQLPAQGRDLHFSAHSVVRISELIKGLRQKST